VRKLACLLSGVALVVPTAIVAVVQPAAATPAAAAAKAPSKIPSLLRQSAGLAKAAASAKAKAASPQARALGVDNTGRIGVQLYAAAPVTAAQETALSNLGVSVLKNSAAFKRVPGVDLPSTGLVSASVPYDKLDAVAALDWVTALRPSVRPAIDVGPITAEACRCTRLISPRSAA
jgi:hypothetical protein